MNDTSNTVGLTICGPPSGVYKRTESSHPECAGARGISRWGGAWYGETHYCECGDVWEDGERRSRPFSRYWRRDAQHRFERMWNNATAEDLYHGFVDADIAVAICGSEADEQRALRELQEAHEAILDSRGESHE